MAQVTERCRRDLRPRAPRDGPRPLPRDVPRPLPRGLPRSLPRGPLSSLPRAPAHPLPGTSPEQPHPLPGGGDFPLVNARTREGRWGRGNGRGKRGGGGRSRIPRRRNGVVWTFRALGGDGPYIKRSSPTPICLILHPLDKATTPPTCGNPAPDSPEVIIPPRAVRNSRHMRAHDRPSGGVDHKRRGVPRVADHREAGIGCGAVGLVNCLTYSRSSSAGRRGTRGEAGRGAGPAAPGGTAAARGDPCTQSVPTERSEER